MKQTHRATCLLRPRKCILFVEATQRNVSRELSREIQVGLSCTKPGCTASSKAHTNAQEQPANTMSSNAAMFSATVTIWERVACHRKSWHHWRKDGRPSSCTHDSCQEPNWNGQKMTERRRRWHQFYLTRAYDVSKLGKLVICDTK